jgi:murein DD-endopeptidase MepM/ murein hydrolase activator NlpD
LKIKKTLSNWLTNRFLLIIRNEENFAEKRTFSFNYAKLIVFGITFLILVFSIAFYLINTILFSWLNPIHNQIETNKKILILSSKVDSLVVEVQRKDAYIINFKRLLVGETAFISQDTSKKDSKIPLKKEVSLDVISETDARFRKEIEEQQGSVIPLNPRYREKEENYFIKPVDGVVLEKYNSKKGDYGIDIITKSQETVKSIADGMVIFSDFTQDGYSIAVQHKNGFISIYRYNSAVLKKSGEFVQAGDPISITGNSVGTENRYKVNFQIWQEGNPVNPEQFISF